MNYLSDNRKIIPFFLELQDMHCVGKLWSQTHRRIQYRPKEFEKILNSD